MRAHHFLPVLGICWAVTSCDKAKESAGTRDEPKSARATKSGRHPVDEAPTARTRFKSAIRKAGAISSPDERNRALSAAIWEVAETDPDQARQDLGKLTPGSEEKSALIQHLAMRLAEQSVDDAVQWASTLDSEEEKSMAYGKIALVISESDPAKAAKLLSDTGVAGRPLDVSVVEVVQRWAQQSPTDALDWISRFSPGEARESAMKEAISTWAVGDTKAAASWISETQDPKLREEGKRAIVQTILDQPDVIQDELALRLPPDMKPDFEKLKAARAEEAAGAPEE